MAMNRGVRVEEKANKKLRAYEILENRIVFNEFKPQEYLNEQALCRDLSISKTPIREALQRLERNRLVVVVPSKGSFVAPIGIDLIREIFEIREILECASARIAAELPSHAALGAELLGHDSFRAVDQEALRSSLLSGYQIHTAIVEAAGNSFLTEYYKTILAHIVRIRVHFIKRFEDKRLRETHDEHRIIIQAIAEGDADRADQAMREHLRNSLVNINQLTLAGRKAV